MSQPLSPAAQAVLDEVLYRMSAGECDSYAKWIAAAALRAAADQVERKWRNFARKACQEIRTIAAELEANR